MVRLAIDNYCVPILTTVAIDAVRKTDIAGWISIAMLCLCVFLLVSYAVLPVKWSHRHYLNVSFTIGICLMQVGWLTPSAAQTDTRRLRLLSPSASDQTNATTR